MVKLSKTIFDASHMELLGMIIGQGKVEMDKTKLDTIKELKPPQSKECGCSQVSPTSTASSFPTSPTLLPLCVTIIYPLRTHTHSLSFPRLSSTPSTEHQLMPSSLVACPLITMSHWTSVHSCSSFCFSPNIRNDITLHPGLDPWTCILLNPFLTFLDDTALSYLRTLIIFPITWCTALYLFSWFLSHSISTLLRSPFTTYTGPYFLSCLSFFSSCFFCAPTRHLLLIALPCRIQSSRVLTQYLCAIYFSFTENLSVWEHPRPSQLSSPRSPFNSSITWNSWP